jgi:transcriptional regulator with XRE-family HTH domain
MQWWQRLDRSMKAQRLSPDTVAERAGINIKSVYAYLNGRVDHPRGDIVKRLAAAVGMTEVALRDGGANGLQTPDIRTSELNQFLTDWATKHDLRASEVCTLVIATLAVQYPLQMAQAVKDRVAQNGTRE